MRDRTVKIILDHNSYFENGVLYNGWNQGFFSCLSVCLFNIVRLYAKCKVLPDSINFSKAAGLFKTDEQIIRQTDIYPMLFKASHKPQKLSVNVALRSNMVYENRDIVNLVPLVSAYFALAEPVLELQKKLRSKYNIDPGNTLCVYMRGTDKSTEVQNATPYHYAKKCKEILRTKPGHRIWIQTDQRQYLEYFLKEFPKISFFIEELPTTEKNIGIHLDKDMRLDRFEFAKHLLASLNLMSQCDTAITYTGNIGYWLALYRGHTKELYQDTSNFTKAPVKTSRAFNYYPSSERIVNMMSRNRVVARLVKYFLNSKFLYRIALRIRRAVRF